MRVLITGGTGHIGKSAVERMLQSGWDVRVIDIGEGVRFDGAEYIQSNILDYDTLLKHMRGCDGVIHLAALPNPHLAPAPETFQTNVSGTFNVFEAAAKTGIRRVVQASSINALGCSYGLIDIHPQYLPIDEEHPSYTTDVYSFSKQTIEEIGAYYWRREGISSVALRLPGVYSHERLTGEESSERRDQLRNMLDELVSLPESERQVRLADVARRTLDLRRQRPLEYRAAQAQNPLPNLHDDPFLWTYFIDRFNFWALLDNRDCAQSLEKGLTADYEGAHVLYINDDHNWLGYDSMTLVRLFFPEVSEFKSDLSGSASLVSIEKGRALIGFEPEYSIGKLARPAQSPGGGHD